MANPNAEVAVNIRIEGRDTTIFDDIVLTTGGDVTTTAGEVITHHADGTNYNQYPFPVPTCTSALAATATGEGDRPTWGATFSYVYDDFFINTIGGEEANPATEFWQLALNFKRAEVGGGQLRVTTGDSILWALVTTQRAVVPLRLNGPRVVQANTNFKITVTDGETHRPVPLATVGEDMTDFDGQVEIEAGDVGTEHQLRANFPGRFVRSNVLTVTVVE